MHVKRVTSLPEALATLHDLGAGVLLLAGGTDVMVQLARGELTARVLLPIRHLEELSLVRSECPLRIGALVTYDDLTSQLPSEHFLAVKEAARSVGGWQTQTVGTIGGNLCNASPAADMIAPLLVHDAKVTLQSASETRELALHRFVLGRRQTALRSDELLTHIDLELPPKNSGDVYLKVGRRSAMEVAIVGYAMRLDFQDDGTIVNARVALASVAPTPIRILAAEKTLIGRQISEEAAADTIEAILSGISPIDDIRASKQYRQQLVSGLTRRALSLCSLRAGFAPKLPIQEA